MPRSQEEKRGLWPAKVNTHHLGDGGYFSLYHFWEFVKSLDILITQQVDGACRLQAQVRCHPYFENCVELPAIEDPIRLFSFHKIRLAEEKLSATSLYCRSVRLHRAECHVG